MTEGITMDSLGVAGSATGTGTVLSTLLALSAMLLALSVAVQVAQEIFKFLRSTRSRVYTQVLTDALGGWIEQLAQPSSRLPLARGPFQFFRSKPGAVLLPLSKEQLKAAVDTLAPDWLGVALDSLKAEVELQEGTPDRPSPQLRETLAKLREGVEGEAGSAWNARRVTSFFERWGFDSDESEPLDAAKILRAFYREFLPQRAQVESSFEQIQTNFDWTYRRYNLRVTFLLALLIAFFLDLPFDGLLRRASSMSPEQAVALAERASALYERSRVKPPEAQPADDDDEAEEPEAEEPEEAEPESADGEPPETEGDGGSADETGPAESPEAAETDDELDELRAKAKKALEAVEVAQPFQGSFDQRLRSARQSWWPSESVDGEKIGVWKRSTHAAAHLLQSLLTALLVSFGAPFWDRITKLLLRANRRAPAEETGS